MTAGHVSLNISARRGNTRHSGHGAVSAAVVAPPAGGHAVLDLLKGAVSDKGVTDATDAQSVPS